MTLQSFYKVSLILTLLVFCELTLAKERIFGKRKKINCIVGNSKLYTIYILYHIYTIYTSVCVTESLLKHFSSQITF